MTPQLVLASNSPRRREILALTGLAFTTRPVDIDERPLPDEQPMPYVLRLAQSKALAARQQAAADEVLLTADTTVAVDGRILGKPQDADDARAMLDVLRGRDHWVYTAVGVSTAQELRTELCATQVWMRPYTSAEVETYIASGDPMDKAGAYAIQHPGFHPVMRLTGCYAGVMGLPLCQVMPLLAAFGLSPAQDVTAGCAVHLIENTACAVAAWMEGTTPRPQP